MKKVKEPKTKGIAKVPLIMQLEALECGAASLAMIMAYYDKWVPLEQVRVDCGVSRDGSNAKNILKAAKAYGFKTKGYALNTQKLRERVKFPCIIHWNKAHFVVLCGFTRNKAIINDPAKGVVKVPIDQFDKFFTGIVLEVIPDEGFMPSGKRKSMLGFARKRLVGAKSLIVFFALTTIIAYVIGIIDPVLKQVFIDNLLGENRHDEWLTPFILVFAGLSILQIIVGLIEAIYQYRMREKLDTVGSSSYMWKVLRLPIEFFSQRMTGDIQQRKNENATIAETLVNVFAPLIFNAIMLVFYLVVMMTKSLILTAIGVFTVLLNAFMTQYISKVKVNITRVQARDNAMLAGMTSKGIEMIETIKSSGAEKNYFYTWDEALKNATQQKLKLARLTQAFGTIPSLLTLAVNYSVLIIGVYLTINNQFTVGSIVAFQGFLSAFMAPATTMIESGQTIQEMRTQMERVDDVMEYPIDENIDRSIPDAVLTKLKGNLELKNVTFGYSKLDNPIITDFNLTVKPGQMVAIVGGTGSGKSTLSKLVSGLHHQWSGEILYDGKTIEQIDHEMFVGSLAVVDQDIILFEDTINNNIKMWDESIEDFEAILAANDARIHDTIMARKDGYNAVLTEGGGNLSGGERQRIEIARALAMDPSIMILDEATSALDAKTEYEVVNAIRKRGITCLVIAHRLSTIRDADLIVVLHKGTIIEQGRHEELMNNKGYYYDLIKND